MKLSNCLRLCYSIQYVFLSQEIYKIYKTVSNTRLQIIKINYLYTDIVMYILQANAGNGN